MHRVIQQIFLVKEFCNLTDLTFTVPIPDKKKKLAYIFLFTLYDASKGFMKALKTFIKPFEAPQRSVKIKIYVDFYFNITFSNAQDEKG